jgi:hypothetical protein
VTDKQLEFLRETLGKAPDEFEREIESIKKDTRLCVADDPQATPDDLPDQVRRRVTDIAERRLRNDLWNHDAKRKHLIEFFEHDIATLIALSRKRGVDRRALVSREDLSVFGAADIPIVRIRWYKKDRWPLPSRPWMKWIRAEYWDAFSAEPQIGIVVVGISLLFAFLVIGALLPVLVEVLTPKIETIVGAVAALPKLAVASVFTVIGVALYFWRSRSLFTYGWAEVLVGITAIHAKVPDLNERGSASVWVTAVLAVYIIVRGLDNIGKALGKRQKPLLIVGAWSRIFGKDSVR